MKEYRLIKKYPSLPNDWEKGMIVGVGDQASPVCFSPCNGKYKDYRIPLVEVINVPEFWEVIEYSVGTLVKDTFSSLHSVYKKSEDGKWRIGSQDWFDIDEKSIGKGKRFQVVDKNNSENILTEAPQPPKNWKILSFTRNESSEQYKGTLFSLTEKGYNPSFKDSNLTLEHCLSGGFNIHSISRIYDSETFTIGDTVRGGIIESIKSERANLVINTDSGNKIDYPNDNRLDKSLCKTEDGKDLFNGDKCWIVYLPITIHSTPEVVNIFKKQVLIPPYEVFCHDDEAKEYILLNKPCLSIKDVQSIYTSAKEGYRKNGFEVGYLEKLKKLVKSKNN